MCILRLYLNQQKNASMLAICSISLKWFEHYSVIVCAKETGLINEETEI